MFGGRFFSTFSRKYTLSPVRMISPVFFSFTVIIWLPGVCATQRFTIDRAVAEDVVVAAQLDHVHRVGLVVVGLAQRQIVAEDVRAAGAVLGPERVLDLVLLDDDRRLRELGGVAAMVQVHVAQHDVLDVVRRSRRSS